MFGEAAAPDVAMRQPDRQRLAVAGVLRRLGVRAEPPDARSAACA
jgi:hypothetical protein